MKRTAPLLLISLSLLSASTLAAGLQPSNQAFASDQDKVLVLNYDGGYVATEYTKQDLDDFKSQLYKQSQTIKELEDKLYRMERDNRDSGNNSSNNLSSQLKEQSREMDRMQRDISDLQRKLEDLSRKVK